MSPLRPAAHWLARLRAEAARPPLRPREPLLWQATAIGSVEPDLFARCAGLPLERRQGEWHVLGAELSPALARIAAALRTADLAHVWRDELLGVRDDAGRLLGAVERAVVRPLGIATHAVHLLGFDGEGRHWVQQRALDKPNDPGLWDTMVGGMVPATDSLEAALERETWEEAGLRPQQLRALRHGGHVLVQRPSAELPHGYVVERLEWYTATLGPGVAPQNQDGEVLQFALLDTAELMARLERDEFTLDAAALLLAACDAEAVKARAE